MKAIRTSRIWDIAYPIIIGNIAQNLLGITDTAFLGHLDDISLGAAALGSVLYLALMMLGMGFSIGIQIIIARRRGEERLAEIGTVLHHAIFFLLPFAMLLWGVFNVYGDNILSLIIRSPNILEATAGYFNARLLGIVFGFTIYICQALFIGIAQTKIISIITCIMVSVNILFDWILIFGNLGFDPMGSRGAALASVVAEFVAMLVYISYIYRQKSFVQYHIFERPVYRASVMKNLIKISIPASLQNFLSVASWFIFFIMIEKLGEKELAISNIGRSLYSLFLLPVWGFASAVNSLVSYSIGWRKPGLTWPILGKVVALTVLFIAGMEIITFIFSDVITSVYTNIPELREGTIAIMPVICLSAMLFGIGFICFNTISGTGNTHISLLVEIIGTIVYITVVVFSVNVWNWGIMYVWLSDGIYGIVMIICSMIYLGFGNWKERKI